MSALVAAFAWNECEGVASGLLGRIPSSLSGIAVDRLLVDDGSSDGTGRQASKQGIEVLRLPRNCGKASAIKVAFTYLLAHDYDFVVTMDCDGQHDPNDLPRFVGLLTSGVDAVLGARFHPASPRDGVPFDRELLNVVIAAGLQHLIGRHWHDVLCGYRGFSRRAVRALLPRLEFSGYGAELEVAFLLGSIFTKLKVEELPIAAVYTGTNELDRIYHPDNEQRRLRERALLHLEQLVELRRRIDLGAAIG